MDRGVFSGIGDDSCGPGGPEKRGECSCALQVAIFTYGPMKPLAVSSPTVEFCMVYSQPACEQQCFVPIVFSGP